MPEDQASINPQLRTLITMKQYRLNRLFNAKSSRCFDVAVDHGFFNQPNFLSGGTGKNRLQDTVVKQQLQEYCEQRRKCLSCGRQRPVKDFRCRRLDTILGTRIPQGSAISKLSVPLRHTGLEPDFGSPLRASDARVASSAGEPGSADFVSQGCGSAANVPPTDWRN
jgi:hypothetical protein